MPATTRTSYTRNQSLAAAHSRAITMEAVRMLVNVPVQVDALEFGMRIVVCKRDADEFGTRVEVQSDPNSDGVLVELLTDAGQVLESATLRTVYAGVGGALVAALVHHVRETNA